MRGVMMSLETDIYQKIEHDFGADTPSAIALLEEIDAKTKGLIGNRMLRAMVFLADGDLDRFRDVIELGRVDYRDVLWQAEYDCGEVRKFDFEKSFHQLGLIERDT